MRVPELDRKSSHGIRLPGLRRGECAASAGHDEGMRRFRAMRMPSMRRCSDEGEGSGLAGSQERSLTPLPGQRPHLP